MTLKELIKQAQLEMGVSPDGDWGPVTTAKAGEFELVGVTLKNKPALKPAADYFGAPWMGVDVELIGRDESDAELNARYVPEWAKVGLPGYKSLVGNARAWCSIRCTKALRQVGVSVKGLTAGAASHSKWGKKSPFWFGATCDIKHASGGRHVCFFLYWLDEKNKIAATLDGNRGNKFCVARTDLSGSGDSLVSGPRWALEVPDGQSVAMADVIAKYPFFKVGASGGSTR